MGSVRERDAWGWGGECARGTAGRRRAWRILGGRGREPEEGGERRVY